MTDQTDKTDGIGSVLETLSKVIPYIFSWVILMPLAIIIDGKFLRQYLHLAAGADDTDLFVINIPPILNIRARASEVSLGFAAFFFTFLIIGVMFGAKAYHFFTNHFGVDPGHWNSLCVLSAFISVVWTFVVFIAFRFLPTGRQAVNHTRDEIIEKLATEPPTIEPKPAMTQAQLSDPREEEG